MKKILLFDKIDNYNNKVFIANKKDFEFIVYQDSNLCSNNMDWSDFTISERMESHDFAFECIEEFYAKLCDLNILRSELITWIYGSRDIERILKKSLIGQLQKLFLSFSIIEHYRSQKINIEFFPSQDWLQLYDLIKRCNISFPKTDYTFESKYKISRNIRHIFNYYISTIFQITRIRRIKKPRSQKIDLIYRRFNSDWGVKINSLKRVDWYAGKKYLEKLYLFDVDEIKDSTQMDKQDLNYVDWSRRIAFHKISLQTFIKKMLPIFLVIVPISLFQNRKLTSITLFSLRNAYIDYVKWHSFLENYTAEILIAYNDVSETHIPRSIILKEQGIKSVFYQHTNTSWETYEYKQSYSGRHVDWSYISYDIELHWSKQQADLWADISNYAQERFIIGPVWPISLLENKQLVDQAQSKWGELSEYTIISVFNTTYSPSAINNTEKHFHFLKGILELINNNPSYRVLFKSKKRFERYTESKSKIIREISHQIINNDNFLLLDANWEANVVIGMSDICISMAFASPAIESIYGGKPAMFFDSENNYPNSYLSKFPDMVVNKENFDNGIKKWLNKSQNEIIEYQEKYIFPEYRIKNFRNASELIEKLFKY